MYVAVYTNMFHGQQRVVGSFNNLADAERWIGRQLDACLWRAWEVEEPDDE